MDAARRYDPVLLSILGIIALLVVLAIAAVLLRGGEDSLEPGSPEGVVQEFASAMIDGDRERARALVSDEAFDDCGGFGGPLPEPGTRVTLRGVSTGESSASVRVGISTGSSGDVFGGSYEESGEFVLVRDGSQWQVSQTPWRFDLCSLEEVE
ncbi:hypothetical protein OH146_04225 [Salinibacterium sp. SYSU T00001]|uniref:hypothetical protein n=1 Tax=Homoserinimonas sedimenticola TaxID=2986805 RepID=UPI00223697AA|nr:hypothetical protein [Salinibacterium sedimenticola]MCW4384976.1 hypothetical protein [Salinibacterium sedimenticola]